MKKIFVPLFVFLFIAFTNLNAQDFEQSEGGLLFQRFENPADGLAYAQPGDIIRLHLKMVQPDGAVLQDSYQSAPEGITFAVAQAQFPGDVLEIFQYLAKGDSAVVKAPVDSMLKYTGQSMPSGFTEGSHMTFYFKILDIKSSEVFQQEQALKAGEKTEQEKAQIKEYAAQMGWDTQETPSGLHYVKIQEGNGEMPAKGQSVKVHYAGRLLSGREFDNSYKRGEPIEFAVGTGRVIKGWDEGIMLMSKGEKGILLIPFALGYGERGAGNDIPPYSTLIFEVELVDF